MIQCQNCHKDFLEILGRCPYCGTPNPKKNVPKCKSCGNTMEQDERFCSNCGTPAGQEVVLYCENCGTKLKPNAKFCTRCGTPVEKSQPAQPLEERSPVIEEYPPSARRSPVATMHPPAADIMPPALEKLPPEPMLSAENWPEPGSSLQPAAEPRLPDPPAATMLDIWPEEQMESPTTPDPSLEPAADSIMPASQPETSVEVSLQPAEPVPTVLESEPQTQDVLPEPTFEAAEIHFVEQPAETSVSAMGEPAFESAMPQQESAPIASAELQASTLLEATPPESVSQPEAAPEAHFVESEKEAPSIASEALSMAPEEPMVREDVPQIQEGHDETAPNTFQPTGGVAPPPARKGKGKVVLIILLLILFALGALWFIWYILLPGSFGKKAPESSLPTPSSVVSEASTPALPGEPSATEASATEPAEYSYKVTRTIPAQWDEVSDYDSVGFARVTLDGKMGIIDLTGQYLVEPTYDSITEFSESVALVSLNGKFGYIAINGSVLVTPQYSSGSIFQEGFAVVVKDGNYYFLDVQGKLREDFYDYALPYSEGFAAVNKNGMSFFIDATGDQSSPMYQGAGSFGGDYAPVQEEGKWGFVDIQFKTVIPPTYDKANAFQGELAIVEQNGKFFFVDREGNERSPRVDELFPLTDGLATAKLGDLYGYVDGTSTEFVIPPQYLDVFTCSENACPVSLNQGIWYYVDPNNQPLFEASFDEAFSYKDGLARVKQGLRYTLIDHTGQPAISESWDGIGPYSQGMVAFKEGGRWGFVEIDKA